MTAARLPDEPMMDLLVPDIVRQSQFLSERASPNRFSGEYRLAMAILEDAIQIYCMVGSGRRNLHLRREAGRWLHSSDRSWCFSFERICEALGLDPDCIRRGVQGPKGHLLAALSSPEIEEKGERRGASGG